MSYAIFLRRFFLLLFFSITLLACWNYTLDIYGIFKEDYSKQRIEINQHFIKMRYLLKNPPPYDAFLFGSSRVGNIDVAKLPGDFSYYNMTYSEGLPQEWLNDLRHLTASGITCKRIIIGLDEFSYKIDPATHITQLLRMPYTNNTLLYYIKLLTMRPNKDILNAIRQANEIGSIYDIYGTGQPLHEQADVRIEENIEEHINDKKFQIPMVSLGHRIDQTLTELKTIKEVANAQGSELIVFFNPIYIGTYLAADRSEMDEFKRRLADITDFYDFSGINIITTNNYNYYEVSHYRPLVGDKIAARLATPGAQAQDIFGFYVTSDNVKEHLANLSDKEKIYKNQHDL